MSYTQEHLDALNKLEVAITTQDKPLFLEMLREQKDSEGIEGCKGPFQLVSEVVTGIANLGSSIL